MAGTFLGYAVASPEQQKKTALLLLLGTIVSVAGVVGFLFLKSQNDQRDREQAVATIGQIDVKCRYIVQNLSKRVSYYDHTGYIDCASAEEVARQNNHPLGSLQRRSLIQVDFAANDGSAQTARLVLGGTHSYSAGGKIEILYRTNDPSDVTPFSATPLGIGKKSLLAQSRRAEDAPQATAVPEKPRRFSKTATMTVGFIILAVILFLVYRTVRFTWRLLSGAGNTLPQKYTGRPSSPRARSRTSGPDMNGRFGQVGNRRPIRKFG